ncbi:MAG: glycosyltransferase [Pseudomonadota bacterium]
MSQSTPPNDTGDNVSRLDKVTPVSVVIAASDVPGLSAAILEYRTALDALGRKYEVICVTDGSETDTVTALKSVAADWPELAIIPQRPWSGDDVALATAVRRANHDLILTLSGWSEVDGADLGQLFDALGDNDMVVAARNGSQAPTGFQGMRRRLLDRVLTALSGQKFSDPFCRVRLSRRQAIAEATAFGARQHFIPVVAAERGYRVTEVMLNPATDTANRNKYVFKPLGHMRALLDGMSLYVVLKFMRRPMRFFGSIGLPIFLVGTIATLVLVGFRLFGDAALADRPALIAFVLMIVLGAQIIAIGLVGEIMIFANAQKIKQYTVRNLIRDGKAKPVHAAKADNEPIKSAISK